jgi:putative ABC transport system substrate-binding protein
MLTTLRLKLGVALVLLSAPVVAGAQVDTAKIHRVGVLTPFSIEGSRRDGPAQGFFDELRKLGWIEGKNFIFDWPDSQGRPELLPQLAEDLVRRKPDLILACGLPAVRPARAATRTIPLVFACSTPDPVGDGLIQTLARPGGNVTGLTDGSLERYPKMLELLTKALPDAKTVAYIGVVERGVAPASGSLLAKTLDRTRAAAQLLGIRVVFVPMARIEEIETAFSEARRNGARAAIVFQGPIEHASLTTIPPAALRHRLPIVGGDRRWAEAGALMSFAADWWTMLRRQAHYMDKILRGADPATLPVENPTKFELVINLTTAKALTLTVPQALLLRADQLVE